MALTAPSSTLTGQTIAASYDQVLFLDAAAGVTEATLKIVSGTAGKTALSISDEHVLVKGVDTNNAAGFEVQQTDGTSILKVAAGTPSVLVSGNATKLYFYDAGGEYISGDGTDLTITSGNDIVLSPTGSVGIGLNPSGWDTYGKVLQIGEQFNIMANDDGQDTYITANRYYASGWKWQTVSQGASQIFMSAGAIKFSTVGTTGHDAGDAQTIVDAMTIDSSANVLIGATSVQGTTHHLNVFNATDEEGPNIAITSSMDGGTAYMGGLIFRLNDGSDTEVGYLKGKEHTANNYGLDIGGYGDVGSPGTIMSLAGTGDVTVSTGSIVISTAGKGVTFSATNTPAQSAGSGTHNTLDDYEEGTWTPTFKGSSGTVGSSATVQRHPAVYTKIGRSVTASCYISWTNQGSYSGSVTVEGLPFTVIDCLHAANIAYCERVDFDTARFIMGYVGGTSVTWLEAVDDGDPIVLPISAFDNLANYFSFQVTYQTT